MGLECRPYLRTCVGVYNCYILMELDYRLVEVHISSLYLVQVKL